MKNAPWSSSGRKPVGVIAAHAADAGHEDRDQHDGDDTATRTSRRHDRGIAVAHVVDAAQHASP